MFYNFIERVSFDVSYLHIKYLKKKLIYRRNNNIIINSHIITRF